MFTDPKLGRPIFGLKSVASSFIAGSKWPAEEIRLGRIIAEAEPEATLEEPEETKEATPALDDLINETSTSVHTVDDNEVRVETPIDAAEIKWGDEAVIEEEPVGENAQEAAGAFVAPTQGTELALAKIKNSIVAGLHCAVGEYEIALRLLQKQIALTNAAPVKAGMKHTALFGRPKLNLLANTQSLSVQLVDAGKLPVVVVNASLLQSIYSVFCSIPRIERAILYDKGELWGGVEVLQEMHTVYFADSCFE